VLGSSKAVSAASIPNVYDQSRHVEVRHQASACASTEGRRWRVRASAQPNISMRLTHRPCPFTPAEPSPVFTVQARWWCVQEAEVQWW